MLTQAPTGCLQGKVAIITGGGKGIGEATARLFAQEGAKVVIATRSLEPGQQVGNAISAQGGEALVVQTLLESRRAVQDVIHAALDHFGSLDIVLHNAASMTPGAISAVTDEELDDILTVNLKAAFWFVDMAIYG